MKTSGSISIAHIILLSMTFIGLKNHVTIIPSLIETTGRDAWISVIIATIIIIPWLYLLISIQKKLGNNSFRDVLLNNHPKVGKVLIYFIAFYLLVMAAMTMRETLQWVSVTFLIETPVLILFFSYAIVCVLFAMSPIQSITIVNTIVLFGVVVLGFFVAFVNMQIKDPKLLLPIFEHGMTPILKSIIYPASGFVELLLFVFIQHHFKKKLKFSHFLIMLFLLFGLTIGPLVGAIMEFGPAEAATQRYPAYEEWRLATIGRFIEHLDFLSIYQWLTGAFVRIGFLIFIVIELLGMAQQKKRIMETIAPAFIFCTLPLFLLNDSIFIELKGKYFLISTGLFFFLLAFIFNVILRKRTNSKAEKNA
ncbi:spore gernimation protein [Solibacillus sp. R5-41]|uniref:endospore germination permease n=1 Tax=Solibacillus sp. R5-41 TaxID=2048654 RepID=UPI000C127D42|nr:endospore germination permease [Solibacillus sp. R5-41]ATP41599.1 spore gernimation protein [Solibacillus sp. R5-41]